MLELKNIDKYFGENRVLKEVSFKVNRGRALGLLGRNGAGKTTSMRILMGLFPQDGGEIYLDGKPLEREDIKIGYLPEERGLYPKKKIIDQLIYLGELRGLTKKEARLSSEYWLSRLGLSDYGTRKLETLSKGNQQKIQLAQTLVSSPDLVVLDEPFSGLDPVNSKLLRDIIRELINEDKLVIFSSHQMAYVEEFCEEIAIINQGEIVLSGGLSDIKKEYGKGRILISFKNLEIKHIGIFREEFKDLLEDVSVKDGKFLVGLKKGKTQEELLSKLMENRVQLDYLSSYEPSLEEIFIREVGGGNEESQDSI